MTQPPEFHPRPHAATLVIAAVLGALTILAAQGIALALSRVYLEPPMVAGASTAAVSGGRTASIDDTDHSPSADDDDDEESPLNQPSPVQRGEMARLHEVVRHSMPDLLSCFDADKTGRSRGPVLLKLVIAGDGKVLDARPTPIGEVAAPVVSCVSSAARKLPFPSHSLGTVEVVVLLTDRAAAGHERSRSVDL